MIDAVMGGLIFVMGVMTAWLGLTAVHHDLKTAEQAFQRIGRPAVTTFEAWDSWFLTGFSAVTVGLRWLFAVVAWFFLALFSTGYLWLEIQLLR